MRGFKVLTLGLAAVVAISIAACDDQPTEPEQQAATTALMGVGNLVPSGSHFNLNVIGVEKGHDKSQEPNGRHTLFVKLWGKCDIDLSKGDFQVTDWTCLDGDAAGFQLPDPADSDADGKLQYSVYVKALTPNGEANIRSCFTDNDGDTGQTATWCNTGDLVVNLKKDGQFRNVSKELLQVCVYDPNTGNSSLEPLFADENDDYLWEYDNKGLRLAQFRFYPVQTTTQGGDCTGKTAVRP